MNRRGRALWTHVPAILVGIGIGLGMASHPVFSQEEHAVPDRSTKATTTKPASKSSGGGTKDSQIERKLDQILSTQQDILSKFDAVLEELRIIKVRTLVNR